MKRAVAFPILALLATVTVAVANYAVYRAGGDWFVQTPSFFVVVRNVAAVALILFGGWALIPAERRTSSLETVLLVAGMLFGIGLAMQFRLGNDAPRQLGNDEVVAVYDSVRAAMPRMPDSARAVARRIVAERNSALRNDFEASRIDTRLARSLERAYGETPATAQILARRTVASSDNPLFRFLPVIVGLLAIAALSRSTLPTLLTARWRIVGFYGSLAICLATVFYLTTVGGVRGANYAPQELLKLSLPIAWAGLLIHYRGAFLADTRERFTSSPLTLWLYVLGLLTLPLAVFVAMRDFGQFLVIGIAQVLLLAYFTRSALYVILFIAGFTASSVVLLSRSGSGEALWTALGIIVIAALAIGALERFRRKDVLWTSATLVLTGYVALATLAVQLPFVQETLATPRARFMLWADLFSRNGDAGWWDKSRQVIESLYALDAGGVLGHGIGRGTPFLIPKASSDFIFSAIAEELGLVGAILIILSFGAIVVIGLRLARDVGRDSFLGLAIAGYVLLIAAQAFVHITGTMNVLPMTGITLPLVSSGMSSLVVAWGMIGCVIGLAARDAVGRERFVIRRPGTAASRQGSVS